MNEPGNVAVRPDVRSTCCGGWGRATLTILIGILLGGAVGWLLSPPLYRSEADVFFNASAPSMTDPLGERVLPFDERTVEAHVALIQSERVVCLAIESREWRLLDRDVSQRELGELRERIEVTRPYGDRVVTIACTDGDPRAAQILVNELIAAYQDIGVEFWSKPYRAALNDLQNERLAATTELDDLRRDIAATARGWGGEQALLGLHIAYMSRVTDLEFRYRELEDRLKLAREATEESKGLEVKCVVAKRSLSSAREKAGELANVHSELEGYQKRHDALTTRLEELKGIQAILEERMATASRVRILSDASMGEEIYPSVHHLRSALLGAGIGAALFVLLALVMGARRRARQEA